MALGLSGVMWVFSGTVLMNLTALTGKKAPTKRQMKLAFRRENRKKILTRPSMCSSEGCARD